MSKYTTLQDVGEENVTKLVKAGVIPYNILRDMRIYDRYIALIKEGKFVSNAMLILEDEYKISERRIRIIIKNIEK